jgi:RND family efflux transporter MFP subunit
MTPPLPLPRRLAAAALASGAALALSALLLPGCAGEARAAPAQAAPEVALVRAAAVERGPVERPIRATGTVAARREYQLGFRAGGLLGEVAVETGERVRRGQVLARLDAADVAAQARQAREAADKAARDLDRVRALRRGGSVPAAALEDAETGAAVAEAASRAADFQLRTAVLLAPEDGWVDRRLAEPGEVVTPGRAVLQLSGTGRGWVVKAAVPEQDVLAVRPGDAAQVTLDARPGAVLAGRVAEVARQPSRGTGTWEVEVRLEPSAEALLPGLTARVALARTVPAAGAVPLAALLDGDGERGAVLSLEGDRVRRVPVRIAFLQGDRAVLAAGLDGVERVVTEGAARLADGARVRLAP